MISGVRICLLFCLLCRTNAALLPVFDFTSPGAVAEWGGGHDCELKFVADGIEVLVRGEDPYFFGPPRNYPAGEQLWLSLNVKSERAGTAQLFYFESGPSEEKSVRFHVPAGDWKEVRVALPALGTATRLRLDPPGTEGRCVIRSIRFETRPAYQQPKWVATAVDRLEVTAPLITVGDLSFRQDTEALGSFEVSVTGRPIAVGRKTLPFGYMDGTNTVWLELTNRPSISTTDAEIVAKTAMRDPGDAIWSVEQRFKASPAGTGIDVLSRVTISADRDLLFVPLFAMFPGVGSFGTNKAQGLFAGVEYLENEPSSSEADVVGPGALRRVPNSAKVTFPLMAISDGERYLGLSWEQKTDVAPMFDSPDRIFGSTGQLMAVIAPGSAPEVRSDGSILPYGGVRVRAGHVLEVRASILGGVGNTVIPAVQEHVRARGWPALPKTFNKVDYYKLAALGWVHSGIRDGARFRHAVGPGFGSQPAADAALLMHWLSLKVGDSQLADELRRGSQDAAAAVPASAFSWSGVGHIRTPAASLVFGKALENSEQTALQTREMLGNSGADGTIRYHAPVNGLDLGKTHYSQEANGFTATAVATMLERAAFAGDRELVQRALEHLRRLMKFRHGVPRGAQTWEVPLHTPDILASAYLVRAFTLGYELTGDRDFLEQASYWAWTGVPFLYLSPPPGAANGVYSSIAVLGATQWVAPLWIGLPVQWCGMVYAHAIRRLARFDRSAPWDQIANGIALSGVYQTHPADDRRFTGLLPDSFDLQTETRNPVPINPATVQVDAIEAYGENPVYDYGVSRLKGIVAHAAGRVETIRESETEWQLRVQPWAPRSEVLFVGLRSKPRIEVNGRGTTPQSGGDFERGSGRLVLQVEGAAEIKLSFQP